MLFGHVDCRTHIFEEIAREIEHGAAHGTDVLYLPLWEGKPVVHIEVALVTADCRSKGFDNPFSILPMNTAVDRFILRKPLVLVKSEDMVFFPCPVKRAFRSPV